MTDLAELIDASLPKAGLRGPYKYLAPWLCNLPKEEAEEKVEIPGYKNGSAKPRPRRCEPLRASAHV
jgi:hypothetical protein